MARVHDVDPTLIERTRRLAARPAAAPTAPGSPRATAARGPDRRGRATALGRLSTTAYIAWAVFAGQAGDAEGRPTLAYLLRPAPPATIDDPYVLALVANALLALDPEGRRGGPYLDRLDRSEQTSARRQARLVGRPPAARRTLFYGGGPSGDVETTALAALALLDAGRDPETVRAALAWLVAQKDAPAPGTRPRRPCWRSRRCWPAPASPSAATSPRRIAIALDGEPVREVDDPRRPGRRHAAGRPLGPRRDARARTG